MIRHTILALAGCALLCAAAKIQPSKNGALLLSDDFSSAQIDPAWKVGKGKWSIEDGALKGIELADDKHAAVVRRRVAYHNAAFEFSFQLNGAKNTHLSLNSAAGHVCRVTIDKTGFVLRKDKTNAKSTDAAATLAKHSMAFEPGKWYTMRVEVRGAQLTAMIGDDHSATGSDPGIDVDKVDIGFPVAGDSAKFDNVRVWRLD